MPGGKLIKIKMTMYVCSFTTYCDSLTGVPIKDVFNMEWYMKHSVQNHGKWTVPL